jgi:hypothetical protein
MIMHVHQGRSMPRGEWRYSRKYCTRPGGHHEAKPRLSRGGSMPRYSVDSPPSIGVGGSGIKSNISSLSFSLSIEFIVDSDGFSVDSGAEQSTFEELATESFFGVDVGGSD